MDKLYTHLKNNGKTDTWLNLATQFNILPNANNKQRSDKVRKFYNRVVLTSKASRKVFHNELPDIIVNNKQLNMTEDNSSSVFEEFKQFLKTKQKTTKNYKPFTEGDPSNILVVGDLHIPFNHSQYLDFCINLQKKYNCGKVIFIGDILDFHASSFHKSDMALPSADFELELSKIEIEKWYKCFPEAVVLIGNHDRMVGRKLFDAALSSHWQKSFNEVLNVPNWKFVNEYIYNNIYFCHGEGPEAAKTCLYKQMSTVQGHQHCLPASYNVLVKNEGTKNIKDVKIGDVVYGYKNGSFCETLVTNTINGFYNGDMYKFNSNYMKQLVTSEHNFYTKNDKYLSYNDFIKEHVDNVVISALGFYTTEDYNISDDMLKLLVATCADGSFDKSNNVVNVRFHLKKDRKIKRLTDIITKLGFNIEWSKQKTGSFKSQKISIELRKILSELIPNKQLPKWFINLSERQIDLVLNELQYWDGYKNISKFNSTSYYCSYKKEERDLVCELLIKRGFLPSVSNNKIVYWSSKINLISKTGKNGKWFKTVKSMFKPKTIQVSNFEIACLETDTSNFIVVTDDGNFELSGNSKTYVQYPSQNIFAVQCPLGVNRENIAFNYARTDTKPWQVGATVIVNSKTPIIELL